MAAERIRARLGTVRVLTTLAAVLVVGLALLLGAMVLVAILRATLAEEARDAAELRAGEIASRMRSGGGLPAFAAAEEDEQFTQILSPAGVVVDSSPNVTGRPPLARLRPGTSAELEVPIDDDKFAVVAVAAETPSGRYTVIVGRALAGVRESTEVVVRMLVIGLPLLLVLVAVTTWWAVGRALRPVEAIRGEVDAISASELHRRVPEPASADEIARLAATMNRMLGRLERAQASQRQFIADASHELRSPVTSIRQHAELAIAHPDRATAGELAEVTLAEGLRMQQLIDDLLLLARADERMLRLAHRPVDLDDVVFDEARRLRTSTGLRVDTTGVSAGRVHGDADSLERLLRNLTSNAARHAREKVSLTLREVGGSVRLTVEDDGPGIPGDARHRVFERFVRLDAARARDHGGSGLGLAIVAEIVRAHSGSVTVAGSILGGTRIDVTLPA